MFFIALAAAIMLLSGEGDDTRAIAALLEGLRRAITQTVPAEPRRARALAAVTRFEQAFTSHRRELARFGRCVEAADRKYGATRADYDACSAPLSARRKELAEILVDVQAAYEGALSPAERARVARIVTNLPDAWVLDPALEAEAAGISARSRRLRGLEGVYSARRLTLPRNVISVQFGPLDPALLGQRYPSGVFETGTSYLHDGSEPAAENGGEPVRIATRVGVRFGLFDDLELSSLFLPIELAPELAIDAVLLSLTQQFRLPGVSLAARVSLHTPSDGNWGAAPGVVLGLPGRRTALQAGVFAPVEVGTLREPVTPRAGLFVPLRAAWNFVPSAFLTTETGFAYDDLARPHGLTLPLGFGAGFGWLWGPRLIELTASFTWDRFFLPVPPSGAARLELDTYRAVAGASVSFQAL